MQSRVRRALLAREIRRHKHLSSLRLQLAERIHFQLERMRALCNLHNGQRPSFRQSNCSANHLVRQRAATIVNPPARAQRCDVVRAISCRLSVHSHQSAQNLGDDRDNIRAKLFRITILNILFEVPRVFEKCLIQVSFLPFSTRLGIRPHSLHAQISATVKSILNFNSASFC